MKGSVVSRNHPIGWSSRDVTEGHVLPIVFDLQMQSTSRHGDRLAMAMYVLRIPMAGAAEEALPGARGEDFLKKLRSCPSELSLSLRLFFLMIRGRAPRSPLLKSRYRIAARVI